MLSNTCWTKLPCPLQVREQLHFDSRKLDYAISDGAALVGVAHVYSNLSR